MLAGEWVLAGILAVILLVFLASALDGLVVRSGGQAAVITSTLVDLANIDRTDNKVGTLSVNPTLVAIAQAKANDMAAKSYFAHTSPDGHDPWYWFALGGYHFSYAGENLAIDFSDSADVEAAWMKSPTHRANLLNSHYTEIGIATAVGTYDGHTTTYVVQEFGTPSHTAVATLSAPTVASSTVPSEPTKIATAEQTTPIKPVVKVAHATTSTATTSQEVLGASVTPPQPLATVATTTTPAPILPASVVEPPPAGSDGLGALWRVLAASPKTTLRYAYFLFGFLILLGLTIETGLELKKHHIRHVFASLALLALMGGLFLIAEGLVFTTPILVEQGDAVTGSA